MTFCRKNYASILLTVLTILTGFQNNTQAQTCPASNNEWAWPTHTNWFLGRAQNIDFGASGTGAPTVSTIVGAGSPFTGYESCASASDEDGNLVLFSNGVGLWDGAGNAIAVPGGGLLTGAEAPGGNNGSAVQGIMFVKHPLNTEDYYIFTTDDALGGEAGHPDLGFNYYVYNKTSNSITAGPTRLGGDRCTEQVAATWHNNGIDIWIVSHVSPAAGTSDQFNAYLLSCSGLDETAVTSNAGFEVSRNPGGGGHANERASLQFQWSDGSAGSIKAAVTHHCGAGTWDPVNSISLLDFNTLTGTFTFDKGLGDGTVRMSNPYDCEWSPDNNRLYVTLQSDQWSGPLRGELGYFDIGSGAYTMVVQENAAGTNDIGSIKLGGDGRIYGGGFAKSPWGYMDGATTVTNPNGAAAGVVGGQATAAGSVGYGMPNMFIPPRDWLEIQDPGALTECDLPYNFSTQWVCKGTDAEMTPLYEDAYSLATVGPNVCGACTIDSRTGEFNAPGAGTYEIHFTICDIADTLIFNIGVCGCDAEVGTADPICAGETFLLDSTVKAASGDGVWTVDSVPATPGVDATIDDTGADTLFDASAANVKYGVYKLMFTVDGSCEDSLYIEVKKNPTVTIQEEGPFCDDSVAVNLTVAPVVDGINVTGAWRIDAGLPTILLPGDPLNFDPVALGAGTYKVMYGVDSLGCYGADSINIFVKERPNFEIDPVGPYCANDPAVDLTITPASVDSGVWGGEADALGRFVPSNSGAGDHDVTYTVYGQCGFDTTLSIHVDPVKDATIATPDSTICKSDPAVALATGDLTGTWHVNDTAPGNLLGGTSFDPALYPAGVYELIYNLPDPCGDLDTVVITVMPDLDATITSLDIDYCNVDTVFNLLTDNPGGVWYKGDTLAGSTLGGTTLNPTDHTGSFKLYYYMSGMCGDVDSIDVTINPLKDATINEPQDTLRLCVLDPNPTFTVADNGGTWNNPAIALNGTGEMEIDLATLGLVTNEMLIYTQVNPCGDKDTIWVTTTDELDATITPVGPFCEDADSVQLVVVDGGGTFSGDGVDPITGWFDPVEAGAGTHRIEYTIGGNCGDVQFIDIVVNDIPDPTITNIDTVQCESYGDIALTTTQPGGTFEDIDPTGGALNDLARTFNTETAGFGTYRIRYGFPTDACPAYDTITMIVIQEPVIDLSGPADVCEDTSVATIPLTFGVTPAASTFTWSGDGDGAGNFDPTGNYGLNTITLSADNSGCTSDSTIEITVLERANANFSGFDFCDNLGPQNLVPDAFFPIGTWTGPGVTGNQIDPDVAGTGTHAITYEIGGRCPDTHTEDVVINTAPDASIVPIPPLCPGDDPVTLTPVSTFTGDFYLAGVATPITEFTPVEPGTYTINYVVMDPCFATEAIDIEVAEVPKTRFTGDTTGCAPIEATFTDVSDEVPTASYWDFGNSQTSTDASGTVSNVYTTVGSFDVTLTNVYANGCSSDTTYTAVSTFDKPTADFMFDPPVLDVDNNQAIFTNTSSADVAALSWEFTQRGDTSVTAISANGENDPVQDVTFVSDNGGTVNVTLYVENANQCVDSITKQIVILDKFSIFIPNAFTPNSDGVNDEFLPVGRNLEYGDDYEYRIYNRWGTLIWMTRTPGVAWDGRVTELAPSSGDIAQIDVYVYRVVVKDPFTGDDYELIGRVSLLK